MADFTRWYFDGSTGCETCNDATGWYDEEPTRPHPNCDCEITNLEELDFEENEDIYEDAGGVRTRDTINRSFTIDKVIDSDDFQSDDLESISYSINSEDYEDEIESMLYNGPNDVREISHDVLDIEQSVDLKPGQSVSLGLEFYINVDQEVTILSYGSDYTLVEEDVVDINIDGNITMVYR